MIYEIGDLIPLTLTLPGNDGTATLTVTDPNGGTTVTSNITGTGGVYTGSYRPTIAGRFMVAWTTTNNASQDAFDVRGTLNTIISLDDARSFLRLRTTDTGDNEKIQGLLETATDLLEDVCGRIIPVTFTEWFDGGVGTYVVRHPPLVSVTSMTEYYGLVAYTLTEQPLGAQMSAYAFTKDASTGQITRRTFGGQAAMFPEGTKNVVITYKTGYSPIPSSIINAARELVKHLYEATQVPAGGGKARVRDSEDGMTPGVTYAVPNFVLDMIPMKYRRPPGMA